MSDPVEISRASGVQIVRLNRPEKKNALTAAMYGALAGALRTASTESSLAVTVILGQPGIFCAGNDVADFFAASQGAGELHAKGFLEALADNDKPLIAGVDGPAIGIGTTLMFHCDMVFASPRAVFQTPFVNLGLVPEAASSLLGPRLLGRQLAFELLVMGEPFSAKRAVAAGFVNHIVSSEQLEGAALAAANAVARKPKEAVQVSRRLLFADSPAIRQRMQEESALFAERVKSHEAREAFAAFLQKAAKMGRN